MSIITTHYYNAKGNRIRKETHARHLQVSTSANDTVVALVEKNTVVFSLAFGKKYANLTKERANEVAKAAVALFKCKALDKKVNLKPDNFSGSYTSAGAKVAGESKHKFTFTVRPVKSDIVERKIHFTISTRKDTESKWSHQISGGAQPFSFKSTGTFVRYVARIVKLVIK